MGLGGELSHFPIFPGPKWKIICIKAIVMSLKAHSAEGLGVIWELGGTEGVGCSHRGGSQTGGQQEAGQEDRGWPPESQSAHL